MSKKNNKSKDTYLRGREVNAVYIDDPEVLFLCDWEACDIGIDCLGCNHTTDISHAKNFEKVAEGRYVEKEENRPLMESGKVEDLVNHPLHYTQDDVETIDKMVMIFGPEATAIHCYITAFKYLSRYKYKENPEMDLEKARWYSVKAFSLMFPNDVYLNVQIPNRIPNNDYNYCAYYVEQAKVGLVRLGYGFDKVLIASMIKDIDNAITCFIKEEKEREA